MFDLLIILGLAGFCMAVTAAVLKIKEYFSESPEDSALPKAYHETLDRIGPCNPICRLYGETDEEFRKRVLKTCEIHSVDHDHR